MRLSDTLTNFWTSISFNRLLTLSIFSILIMIIGLCDLFLLNGKTNLLLQNYVNPNMYFIFIGFPHVFASFLTFFHRNYFHEYKSYLSRTVFPLFILSIAVFFLNFSWYKILFCFLLSYHIGGQAIGVTKIFLNKRNRFIETWKHINIAILFVGFLLMYASDVWLTLHVIKPNAVTIIFFLSLISLFFSLFVLFEQKSKKQRVSIALLQAQFLGIAIFSYKDSFLFWGLMITLVHDAIAFIFYLNHEKNSNESEDINTLHSFTGKSILPILLLSILISFSITKVLNFYSIPYLMFSFQIMHYLIESDIWKTGRAHRSRINISW